MGGKIVSNVNRFVNFNEQTVTVGVRLNMAGVIWPCR
jgi:hypothetical protein